MPLLVVWLMDITSLVGSSCILGGNGCLDIDSSRQIPPNVECYACVRR